MLKDVAVSIRFGVLLAGFCLTALPLGAETLPAPQEDVILTISGDISVYNDGETAKFDIPMLESLENVTYETSTIWTEGTQTFVGVPIKTLMETVGAEGGTVKATAINDYSIDIPEEDWMKGDALLAFLRNGSTMSVRDKGPLWVVYPYDIKPDEYQNDVIYSRSIWQLDRMTVVDE